MKLFIFYIVKMRVTFKVKSSVTTILFSFTFCNMHLLVKMLGNLIKK